MTFQYTSYASFLKGVIQDVSRRPGARVEVRDAIYDPKRLGLGYSVVGESGDHVHAIALDFVKRTVGGVLGSFVGRRANRETLAGYLQQGMGYDAIQGLVGLPA